jgi:head-tail adaptor
MIMADEFAGALCERVVIEAWVAARDDAGADVGHWQAGPERLAAIEPDGVGRGDGEARRSRRRWRVTLRQPVAVGLTSRLRWDGLLLVVLAMEPDPRRRDRIMLRCEAREA